MAAPAGAPRRKDLSDGGPLGADAHTASIVDGGFGVTL